MKIISLNTWGGRAGKAQLLNFFKAYADKVDIFCLQEVWSAPYEHLEGHKAGGLEISHDQIMVHGLQEIAEVLVNYTVYFHPQYLDNYGLMILVKKDFDVFESGEVFVYKHKGYIPPGEVGEHARNVQYVSVKNQDMAPITVMNFHGLWTTKQEGKGKQDIPERIEQSQKIIEFTSTLNHPFVLCGDFNLLPTTESIKILEEAGLTNLIKEYGITSTRTSYYPKPEKFADYAFVSNGVEVKDFKVLPDEVSDHSPLYLEIEMSA